MNKDKLKELINKKEWLLLIENYSPKSICCLLNFKEAMLLSERLFFKEKYNYIQEQFALNLALEIKNHFKVEWKNDWKNEVFLGAMYNILCLYDEKYVCYKKAYDQLEDPPATLLFFLSNCNDTPDIPPITDEEAESYLKRAVEKKITYEVALSMRTLCRKKGETIQAAYWDQLYHKLEREKVKMDYIIPDVLNN